MVLGFGVSLFAHPGVGTTPPLQPFERSLLGENTASRLTRHAASPCVERGIQAGCPWAEDTDVPGTQKLLVP